MLKAKPYIQACPILTAVCLPNFRISKIRIFFETRKYLIINVLDQCKAQAIYKYILAPCAKMLSK